MQSRILAVAIAGALASFAAGAQAPATQSALQHLQRVKQQFGLTAADLREAAASSTVYSEHNRVTHVYLQQFHRGIEVWGAIANFNVMPSGEVLSASSRFFPNLEPAARGQTARQTGLQAVQAAARHLNMPAPRALAVLARKGGSNDRQTVSRGGIAARDIDAKLVWLPQKDGAIRLAWAVEIEAATGSEWWTAFVDAQTGASLGRENRVIEDSAHSTGLALGRQKTPKAVASAIVTFPSTDGATYRVFPMPLESPTDGDRVLVNNAAFPFASPFGWHDTDGAAGPEFTITRGNNVHAYADRDANNSPDVGSSPDGGPSLIFDFPLALDQVPAASQPAFVTNLFYWNNIVHDVTYVYGFNEVSGNFQVNNYGKGGAGNDDVRAEAQDGSGKNNANFGTSADGQRPRMQMFEWRTAQPNPVTVQAPSPIAGVYQAPQAGFGEALATATGPLSGPVVYINDGTGVSVNDGCEAFSVPAGSIPMMDRGNCNFTVKVKNAQNAGAKIAIVVNNTDAAPTAMGGSDNSITIPSVMISLADGALFKANLPLSVSVADGSGGAPDRDSDLDAGIIAHEYGHGISNRLTGGPATASCLGNAEQMGEGWSDWFGMTLTTHPTDTRLTARGVGTYVSFETANGTGIRPTPYSTDMAVNPSTYRSVADTVNISSPHGIGYVWNTMLWEMYWNLVDRYGYNANLYQGWQAGGNNLAFQLVMDGMKFQPCSPGFVDGRNAILAADVALTNGANQCEIWRGFAKRGLGFSASQGSSNNRSDGVEAFDLPAQCTSAAFGGFKAPLQPAPMVNTIKSGTKVAVKFTLSGVTGIPPMDSQPVDCNTLVPTNQVPTAVPAASIKRQGDLFQANWGTDASWSGTCRRLTVRVPSAENAVSYFSFY
jgi:hypothetical protein